MSGSTSDDWYAQRLLDKEGARWKRWLDVQAPYRWNLRRQGLGRTLDVGCGIGRNLGSLPPGSVGVDHNKESVAECRRRGLTAFTTEEWEAGARADHEHFDSLLLAHVIEHLDDPAALLSEYVASVRPGGAVFLVCPQERGYASDPTHVTFTDGRALTSLARGAGLDPGSWFSFPLPRWAGRIFVYNEFCLLAHVPGDGSATQVAPE
jgi:SAM-dependent methyltransferase